MNYSCRASCRIGEVWLCSGKSNIAGAIGGPETARAVLLHISTFREEGGGTAEAQSRRANSKRAPQCPTAMLAFTVGVSYDAQSFPECPAFRLFAELHG